MRPRGSGRPRPQTGDDRRRSRAQENPRYYPLPRDAEAAASGVTHPGLLLDRFAGYPTRDFSQFDQDKGQKPHIKNVVNASRVFADEAKEALARWNIAVAALPDGKQVWSQKTIWRLALHLSRASSLENASVCLHPVYGFAYLPGTGLKGLARSYAVLQEVNENSLRRIFGYQEGQVGSSGNVVFLDAWPEEWPALDMDIVNSHHPEYYRNRGVDSPPGDWESPNPVYFLAVAPGTTFRFAIFPREPSAKDDTRQAAEWLKAALKELGAGAKTAAGYGYFGEPLQEQQQQCEPAVPAGPPAGFRREFERWVGGGKQAGQMSGMWAEVTRLLQTDKALAAQALRQILEADPHARRRDKFRELAAACNMEL